MSEALYIEMPARKKGSPRPLWLRLIPLWALLLLLAAGMLWWLAQGRVSSERAMLDAMVHVVAPEFSAPVEAFYVKEGDRVRRGQPLLRMNARAYQGRLGEAGREAAALRGMAGPPTMEETAARLKAAQDAEQDMVRRLAQARNEEDVKQQLRQERVATHVRLQLHLRSIDSQGGERSVGKSRYAEASQAEAQARRHMEQAKVEFEEASRMRAAMEQELGRIRQEMLRFKQMASQQRYAPVPSRAQATPPVVADANLYAPVDSRVLRVLGVAGQPAQRGEALVLLLPEGASVTENYWVQAYFMGESADFIQPGQPCRVELEDGQNLRGVVQDVLAPQALPTGQQGAQGFKPADGAAKPAMYVPVRVSVDPGANPLPAPGTSARCVVLTRSILGFYGF